MINSLLLKIKYKLYVIILFTSIPFVFASISKFILLGVPIPATLPYICILGKMPVPMTGLRDSHDSNVYQIPQANMPSIRSNVLPETTASHT